MSFPPPPPPLYKNISDVWGSVIGKDGVVASNAVPALQTNSSDSEVQLAEKNIENTQKGLTAISSAVNEFRSAS
jgi:hypothetical protein